MKSRYSWILVLLAGCLALQGAGIAIAETPSAQGATVAFGNLSDGDVVPPDFTVKFTISGMGIAPAGAQIENTGHFHLLIDLPELPAMDQPLPVSEHIRHYGKGQTQDQLNLAEGEHSLQLLLADYAHVPHDPPVMSKVITIVVARDAKPPTGS
jgi:hypothetical protein